MARPKHGRDDSARGGGEGQTGRRRRRRTRPEPRHTVHPVDDFVNQSEDAVALGYRVLEQTVEEIKKGYKEAQAFNRKQEEFERQQRSSSGRRAPARRADDPLGADGRRAFSASRTSHSTR